MGKMRSLDKAEMLAEAKELFCAAGDDGWAIHEFEFKLENTSAFALVSDLRDLLAQAPDDAPSKPWLAGFVAACRVNGVKRVGEAH